MVRNLFRNLALLLGVLLFVTSVGVSQTNSPEKYRGGDISFAPDATQDSITVTYRVLINCGEAPGAANLTMIASCQSAVQFVSDPSIIQLSLVDVSDVCDSDSSECNGGSFAGGEVVTYEANFAISELDGAANCSEVLFIKTPDDRYDAQNISNVAGSNDRMRLSATYEIGLDTFNSSPVFDGQFAPLICGNSDVNFDVEVSDPDGDSLVFSIRQPDRGSLVATTFYPYIGGQAISGITIDSESGILSFTSPSTGPGAYQVVIQVDEYNRATGQQIGMVYRDFQFEVDTTCTNDGPTADAAFTSLVNTVSTIGNDTVIIDTGSAASFRLLFSDANGIAAYSSNAVSVLGGNATFNTSNSEISWTPDSNDIGVHIVTISATDNACEISGKGAKKIVIVVRATAEPLVLTGANTTNNTCPSPPNGSLIVQFTGGTGPFSFQIEGQFTGFDSTQSSPTFLNLPSDNYRITIVDSFDLSDTSEIAFTHSILNLSFEINSFTEFDEVSCDDACDGRIRVNPNTFGAGGLANYTYLWSSGETTRTASSLCGGSPVVTVTDTAGCELIDTVFLFEPPAIFAAVDSTDSASCFGSADGAGFLSANGGIAASTSTDEYIIDQTEGSFEPYPFGETDNVSSYQTINLGDNQVSNNINIGFSFDYYGETFTRFKISSNGFITLGTSNFNSGCCAGQNMPNAADPDNVIAGYWNDLNPGQAGTIETYEAGSGANEVRVINFINVPHFGAGDSNTFQIVLYESSNIIQIYGRSLSSNGTAHTQGIEDSDGDTALTVAGRNSANWSAVNDYVSFIPSEQAFTYTWSSIGSGESATNLTAGTYDVTVEDASGCDDIVQFDVFSPDQIVIDTVITPIACAGGNDGQIVASAVGGDGGPYIFTWNTGFIGTPIIGLAAGTYTVTVEDASGCQDSLTVVVPDADSISITFNPVNNVLCLGDSTGSATALASGGTSGVFNYNWNGPLGVQIGTAINNLPAGQYFVTATDGNTCSGEDSITITEPVTAVSLTSVDSTDESCPGAEDGTATAIAAGGTGGITFAWSNSGIGGTINNLTADTYVVTATDANGCEAIDSTVVNISASAIEATASALLFETCAGDDGEATVSFINNSGIPTFSWSNGQITQTIIGLSADTYSVTVTDINGCSDSSSIIIEDTCACSFDSTTMVIIDSIDCLGDNNGIITSVPFNGTGPFSFVWSTGSTNDTLLNLNAGTYTVTITDNGSGASCTVTDSITLIDPVLIDVTITLDSNVKCNGATDGGLTAVGSGGTGGITYVWNTGANTPTISGLAAGDYTVTVEDANGCVDSATQTITQPTVVSATVYTPPVIAGYNYIGEKDSLFVYFHPNQLTWSAARQSALNAGGDLIVILDSADQAYYTSVLPGDSWIGLTDEVVEGTWVWVDGTVASYFNWNAGEPNNLGNEDYVHFWPGVGFWNDLAGWQIRSFGMVIEKSSLNLSNVSCNGGNDGSVVITGAGGVLPYTYSWDNGAITDTITGLTAGTYIGTVTDSNGCFASDTAIVTEPDAIVLTMDSTALLCAGDTDGTVNVFVDTTTGVPPFSYLWNTGDTTDTITNLGAGTYVVTVTDSNSCTAVDSVTLFSPITVSFSPFTNIQEVSCDDACDGEVTANATSVNGGVSYLWSNGFNTQSLTGLCGGSYTVTATDAIGCEDSAIFALVEPPSLWVRLDSTDSTICTAAIGEAHLSAFGGFAASSSTTTYIIDQDSGEFEPYGVGEPLNANSYQRFTLDDDATTDSIEIFAGGSFEFFGETKTQFVIASQGLITFDMNYANIASAGGMFSVTGAIPSVGGFNNPKDFIAGYWHDLFPDTLPLGPVQTVIETYEIGIAPNRVRVVNFVEIDHWLAGTPPNPPPGQRSTFQISLYENSNIIQIHSDSLRSDGGGHVMGIENSAETEAFAVPGRNNVSFEVDNDYVAFIPQQTFTFNWSSIGNSASQTNLTAGTYTVTVQDPNGCADSISFEIFQADSNISAGLTVDAGVSCTPPTDVGALSVTPTGGLPLYTQVWSNASTAASITSLAAGTYTVTVTDANGCADTAQVTLAGTSPNIPTPTILTPDTSVCAGTTFTIEGTYGANNTFSDTSAYLCTNTSGGLVTAVFSNVPATATGDGTLTIEAAGDLGGFFGFLEFLTIVDEDGNNVGTFQGAANDCDTTDQTYTIDQADINSWAANNVVTFVIDASFFVTANTCNNTAFCAQATFTFPTEGDSAFWFDDPLTLDTALAIGGGDSVEVTPTTNTSYYYAAYNGVCFSEPDTIDVTVLPSITASITQNSSVSCPGDSIALTASAVGGTGIYNFVWDSGDTSNTVNLPAGTWCVTITDVGGNCEDTACVNIAAPDTLQITALGIDPLCNGENSGSASAITLNGTNPITLTWSNGQNGSPIVNLIANTYIVTATDSNGCTASDTVDLTDPPGMTATFQNIVPSGCNVCSGEAEVDVIGGTLPLTYEWPNAQTTAAATALCQGINQVTVTDNNLCVDSFAIAIPSDSADTVIALGTDPLCAGDTSGLVFTSNTCTGVCNFIWRDSATSVIVGNTDTVINLAAGTYIVELINGSNCSAFDTVRLEDPAGLSVTITSQTNVSCIGGNDGTATVSASGGAGGITISWSTGATGNSISGLTAGTYTAFGTDINGCVDSIDVIIDEPATGLSVVAITDSNVTCNGGNDGGVSAVASGGTGAITLTWNGVLNGSSITGLTAGQYVVIASDAVACTATDTAVVTEPTPVIATLDSLTNPTCPGDADGQITVTGSGGEGTYSYAWASGNTSNQETGLSAGVYCVTITDGDGCDVEYCDTIVDPAGMTNTFTGVQNATCGVCDGEAIAVTTGGNGSNYTYIWNNGVTIDTNTTLCVGVNTVTITDSLGCELIDAVPTSEDGADTVTADSIPGTCGNCDGEAFAIYNCNNGPCTVSWTAFGSATVIGTSDTISDLCAGTYFVQLTNNAGCSSVDEVGVTVPDTILPNETIVDVSCGGGASGSITLAPTGGSGVYTYTWSNGAGNTATNTNLTAGDYTVTIADNAACDTVITFTVNPGSDIILNETIADASCFGEDDGSITLAPTGGAGSFTYEWNPIPANGQGVQSATGLTAGDYFVTVTDVSLCSVNDTFTVGQGDEIVQTAVSIDSAACGICDGEIDPTFTGGAGGFTFSWSNGSTSNINSALCFGFYEVTVTDANTCTEVFGYPVSETDGPEISLSGQGTSAQGVCDGEAYVTVVNSQGNVSFTWSTGSTNDTITGLCAGQYVITATDINGCSTVDTININEPNLLEVQFAITDITCAGGPCDGEIVAIPNGGVGPYTFDWSNGSTNDTISGLCVGTYTVTLSDVNGTQVIDSVTLVNPSPFVITPTVVATSCPGTCDGSISLSITGPGIPSIIWDNGDTTATISSLCAGEYRVTVSDTSGCEDSLVIEVTSPPALTAIATNVIEPDCQIPNGSITVTPGGGNGTYSFEWFDFQMNPLIPAQTSATATNLFAGIYNLILSDINGCQDTFEFILNNLNAPSIGLDTVIDASCFGVCDGEIQVTVTGGTAPYVFNWSSGGTMEDDSALCAGIDTLVVADSNLCLAFASFEVSQPDELLITELTSTGVICGDDCDGTVFVAAAGGSAPYTYNWSNGVSDTSQTDLCAGVYQVTVLDGNGCELVDSVEVQGPESIVVSIDSTTDATCDYISDGNVIVSVAGGSPDYVFTWIDQDSNVYTSQNLRNVLPGTYNLTVTDTAGCTAITEVQIGVRLAIFAGAGADIEVCPNTTGIELRGADSLSTSRRWIREDGEVLNEGRIAQVDLVGDTSIVVYEAFNEECVARDTAFVLASLGPQMDAGPDLTIEPGEEIVIGGNPTSRAGVTELTWTPTADLDDPSVANPLAFPILTTQFYVSGVDEDGCFGIDSMLLTVEKIVDPVGGFSPNGDGVNEFFVIDRIENFPDAQINIFNRWGTLIFESDPGYTTPWDGTFNGKTLTVGTYYYIIDLKDDAVDELITGPVSILK